MRAQLDEEADPVLSMSFLSKVVLFGYLIRDHKSEIRDSLKLCLARPSIHRALEGISTTPAIPQYSSLGGLISIPKVETMQPFRFISPDRMG